MMELRSVLLLACGLLFVSAQAADLKLTVYYETLCPDSKRFISNQLFPVYQQYGDQLEVEFVPFGKAKYTGDVLTCQHGDLECQGNKLQSCAVSVIQDQSLKVDFVDCIMNIETTYTESLGVECAEILDIDYAPIAECLDSSKADELVKQNGEKTANLYPPLTFVPSIAFNDEFDYDRSNEAVSNLGGLLQELLPQHLSPKFKYLNYVEPFADGCDCPTSTEGSTGGETPSTTEGSTDGETPSSTEGSTDGETPSSTEGSTDGETPSTTEGSTDGETPSSTEGSTDGETPSSTEGSTDGETPSSTEGSTDGETPSSTEGSTDGETPSSTEGSTDGETPSSTEGSTDGETPSSTEGSTDGETPSSTEGSTDGETPSSTEGSTDGETPSTTEGSTDGETPSTTEGSTAPPKKQTEYLVRRYRRAPDDTGSSTTCPPCDNSTGKQTTAGSIRISSISTGLLIISFIFGIQIRL